MCIIVDTCVASFFFDQPTHPDNKPVHDWIMDDGMVVYGGGLAAELELSNSRSSQLRLLRQNGSAYLESDDKVNIEMKSLANLKLASKDLHVLALARATGARILYTNDHALEKDFCDIQVIYDPKGEVYKRAEHAHLLKHSKGCPGRKKSKRS